MNRIEQIRADKEIIEQRMKEWADMMEEEYNRLVEISESLEAIRTLYNAKASLIEKGYFEMGYTYAEVHHIAKMYRKYRSLNRIPRKKPRQQGAVQGLEQ